MTRRSMLSISITSAAAAQAQDILERKPPEADARIPYGPDPNQFADLRLPKGKGPHPLLINIHGGFWRARYDLNHNGHLCEALRQKGVATWSIEYRRVGQVGGGWPGTFEDVKTAAEYTQNLAKNHPVDPSRIAVMGHSAGGHLALWLAAELDWPIGAIALAGVVDLVGAAEKDLGKGIVQEFLGGSPSEKMDRYQKASPLSRLPLKKKTVLIHGEKDNIVPIELARKYLAAARSAGDPVELRALPNTGHFELIDPQSPQWASVERSVLEMLRIS